MQRVNLKNKKIFVLGLGKTGVAVARLLHQLGNQVTVNDLNDLSGDEAYDTLKEEFKQKEIQLITGHHPVDLLDDSFDFFIKNPGIPYTNVMVEQALALNLPVITDIELVEWLVEAPIVAITGSNGKTTTTEMTAAILKEALNHRLKLGGNIGIPMGDIIPTINEEDTVLMEVSSFQLVGTETFKPHIAAITNLHGAHYDYHGGRDQYLQAKYQITKNQTSSDYLVYNANESAVIELTSESKAIKVPYNALDKTNNGASFDGSMFYFNGEQVSSREVLKVPGQQNVENALIAIAIAKLLHIDNSIIQIGLSQFKGVKHRLQFVKQWKNRLIYNDSKATNTTATKIALESFTQPTVLIAGGLERHEDLSRLDNSLSHVKHAVVYGEIKKRLADYFTTHGIPVTIVNRLNEATEEALKQTVDEDILLLSPSAASWDQFKSFEERGDCFLSYIEQLTNIENEVGEFDATNE
ncbi:UDP-N-acetylmuramoyl-L-alanine--D-glutamate ligase [Atopobacter phocae]|uniref:UDP-N-acetylmuramoyl-L-alanine--D-glutamate ligase n=1 Tax=Atopobacter phocae TaxID=136492 RepID=UPI000470ED45|nr:UDP-N-acetylmuramoyl-L-alanine--D-glutamate ligase [Atopobacter phocae]